MIKRKELFLFNLIQIGPTDRSNLKPILKFTLHHGTNKKNLNKFNLSKYLEKD